MTSAAVNRPADGAPASEALGPASAVLPELPRYAIGVDVGGTGIKGGVVDLKAGDLVSDRVRFDTPQPATPEAVRDTVEKVLDELVAHPDCPAEKQLAVGVTFPAIVIDNVVLSAANIDKSWIECDAGELMGELPGRTACLNDADAAGLAEARYGAGDGKSGTIMMVTLGTGVGSALVHDGVLVPNSELGHVEFEGVVAETKVSARARERAKQPWDEYGETLRRYLAHLWRIQPVSQFIIGGGISTRAHDFLPQVTGLRAEVSVAKFQKNAGIVGAALFAAEQAQVAALRS
ncbi:polyphosphate--glucose phosphotransferase [Nesterenkonia populi]|uniref:polyphosphate--glucose phosphotransferase n=1 Tax=Nesterenkonia populi TaxID=1591087 RepID=UPI0011BED24E|nr:ROK family protein [Nesterenkonia populi]